MFIGAIISMVVTQRPLLMQAFGHTLRRTSWAHATTQVASAPFPHSMGYVVSRTPPHNSHVLSNVAQAEISKPRPPFANVRIMVRVMVAIKQPAANPWPGWRTSRAIPLSCVT